MSKKFVIPAFFLIEAEDARTAGAIADRMQEVANDICPRANLLQDEIIPTHETDVELPDIFSVLDIMRNHFNDFGFLQDRLNEIQS